MLGRVVFIITAASVFETNSVFMYIYILHIIVGLLDGLGPELQVSMIHMYHTKNVFLWFCCSYPKKERTELESGGGGVSMEGVKMVKGKETF